MERCVFLAGLLLALAAAACSDGGGAGGDGGADTDADTDADADAGADAGPQYVGAIGAATYLGPWGGAVKRIAEDPTAPGRVVAIVGSEFQSWALFASEDGGQSWADMAVPTDLSVSSVLFLDSGRLIVGTDFEILVTDDFGGSWDDIRGNIEEGSMYGITVGGLAYAPGDPGTLWAVLHGTYAEAPIWSLADGATDWTPWSAPAGWADDELNGAATFTDVTLRHDPGTGEDRIFASFELGFSGGGGVFCSLDSGATWANCSGNLPAVPYYAVIDDADGVAVAGGHIFGGALAGVWYSLDDGATWADSTDEIDDAIANDVIRLAGGDYLAATYGAGLWRTDALDAPWAPVAGFGAMSLNALAELSGGDLLANPEQLGTWRSADDGATWAASAEGMDRIAPEYAGVDPADPDSAVIAVNSLNSGLGLHTADGVAGWGPIAGLPGPRFSFVDIAPSGTWYAVSDGPSTVANDGIYSSVDDGASFSFLGPLDGPNMDHAGIRVVEFGGPDHLFAFGNYFIVDDGDPWVWMAESVDSGWTWTFSWEGSGTNGSYSMADMAALADGTFLLAVAGQPLVRLTTAGEATVIPIEGQPDLQIYDLATCAADPERWIALGVDTSTWAYAALATADGGATWAALPRDGFADETAVAVEMHPWDCDLAVLSGNTGIVRATADGGDSWAELDVGDEVVVANMRVIRLDADLAAALVLWGRGGVTRVDLTTAPAE